MNTRFISLSIVCLMLVTALPLAMVTPAQSGPGSRALTTPDNLVWNDPVKLTKDDLNDTYPYIGIVNEKAHVLYLQDNSVLMYQLLDKGLAGTETNITDASITMHHSFWGMAQPVDYVALDGSERVHLLRTQSSSWSPSYQKFKTDGSAVMNAIDPAPGGGSPHCPSLALGGDNNAYIGVETIGGGHQGYLSRVDPNGAVMMNGIGSVEGIAVAVDQYNGSEIHVITKGWSGGLSHSRWHPNLTNAVAPHPLNFATSFSSPSMPRMTVTQNGHVHMLIADGQALPLKLYYIEIDENGSFLTDPILLTSTAVDFGAIASEPKKNEVYVAWGDQGDGYVYYNKVVEGREADSLAKGLVKLTVGLEGVSSWPSIAIDNMSRIHIAFVNEGAGGDLDSEIYYMHSGGGGIRLSMTDEDRAMASMIQLGEVRASNVTATNIGSLADTLNMKVSIDPADNRTDGWAAWSDHGSYELIGSGSAHLFVYVKGPRRCVANETVDIVVEGTSRLFPDETSSLRFNVTTVCSPAVSVHILPEYPLAALPSEAVKLTVELVNTGNTAMDLELMISKYTPGWVVALESDEVLDLAPGDDPGPAHVNMTVTVPSRAMADDVGSITVRAFMKGRENVSGEGTVRVFVSPEMTFHISCFEPEKTVLPGESVTYDVQVAMTGNVPSTVIYTFELVQDTGKWTVAMDQTSAGVTLETPANIVITVTAPADARAGENLTLPVDGTGMGPDDGPIMLITTVDRVRDLTASGPTDLVQTAPGTGGVFNIMISNKGNADEDVMVETETSPVGWEIVLPGNAATGTVKGPGTISDIAITAIPPKESLAGNYDIEIIVRTGDNAFHIPITLTATVTAVPGLVLTPARTSMTGAPGTSIQLAMELMNTGNCWDRFALSLHNTNELPAWRYGFSDGKGTSRMANYTIQLEPDGSAPLVFTLDLPWNMTVGASGSFTIVIEANSTEGAQGQAIIDLAAMLPDLWVGNPVLYPDDPRPEKEQTVTVTVGATGIVDVTNVEVFMYDNGVYVATIKLETMKPGEQKDVVFNWTPKAGEHNLKFVIDPNGAITESDEDNNEVTTTTTARGASSSTPGFECVFLVVAVIGTVAVLSRRKD